MDGSTLRCSGCLNIKSLLRILNCKHELCELCCKKYFQKADVQSRNISCIICPIDLELTIMANDFSDLNELPKKLTVNLLCDNCSQNQPLDNHWWCNNCNETICSWCAMQNHRSHDCTAWADGKVVQECLRIFDPFLKSSPKIVEADIDEFCAKLASELKMDLRGMNEIEHAANSMKLIFGSKFNSITSTDEYQPPIDKFGKKLHTMNLIMSSIGQEFAFDVVGVNSLCKSLSGKQLHIPTVKMVADLFYKNSNVNLESKVKQESKPGLNLENKTDSIAGKSEEVLKEPSKSTAKASFDALKPVNIKWELYWKTWFENPLNICAVPNVGVVVLDKQGIHLLNQKLEIQKKIGWANSCISEKPRIAYHPTRNSILILYETKINQTKAQKIIERQIPTLKQSSVIADFKDNENRLLGVSKSGCVVCATSTAIWVKNNIIHSDSTIVWRRDAAEIMENVTELFIAPQSTTTAEEFYLIGTTTVYVFVYMQHNKACHLMQKIASNIYSPITSLLGLIFYSNHDRTEMISFVTSNQQQTLTVKVQSLNDDIKSDKIVMYSDDIIVYLLNCSKSMLYKGKLISN